MLWGRSIQLWTNLVQAFAAAAVAVWASTGNEVNAAVVATLVALALAALGLLANQSATGTLLGRKP
jgi:hypothetical protein